MYECTRFSLKVQFYCSKFVQYVFYVRMYWTVRFVANVFLHVFYTFQIKIRLSYNMYENGITYAGTVQDLCALDLPCYNSLQDLRLHFVSETVPEPGVSRK
jgi:hypothetical protein